MKKKRIKAIRQRLIVTVEKVMTDNNDMLLTRIEKDLKKAIKAVAKKSSKKPVKKKVAATK